MSLHFCPPKITIIVKVVDRHIGVRYKDSVYSAYCKAMATHLNASLQGTNETGPVSEPSIQEKGKF